MRSLFHAISAKRKSISMGLVCIAAGLLQGNVYAQAQLGYMYQEGEGVFQDDAEAVRLSGLAAAQDIADAQSNLGFLYENGRGVVRDFSEAARLYKLAAVQGLAEAQIRLGKFYLNGRGVIQDYARAYVLFDLAATGGDAEGQRNRDMVEAKMTSYQIAHSRVLAMDFKERGMKIFE